RGVGRWVGGDADLGVSADATADSDNVNNRRSKKVRKTDMYAKRGIGLALLTGLSLALSGCSFLTGETAQAPSGSDPSAQTCSPQTMRVAMIRTATDPGTIAAQAMAERVKERTDGALDIQIFPDSQLGN